MTSYALPRRWVQSVEGDRRGQSACSFSSILIKLSRFFATTTMPSHQKGELIWLSCQRWTFCDILALIELSFKVTVIDQVCDGSVEALLRSCQRHEFECMLWWRHKLVVSRHSAVLSHHRHLDFQLLIDARIIRRLCPVESHNEVITICNGQLKLFT